jgi:maleamate amidohydrolase
MNPWGDRIDSATLALMSNRKVAPFAGRRPALVAIDLYDLVYDGGPRPVRELMEEYPSSCGEYAWKALPPTIELYETARRSAVPVVHVTYDTRAETDGKVRPTNRQRMRPDRGLFKIKEELSPVNDELVVYKKRASAFFGTPLPAFLNEMGADSLFIVGESTSGCVRSSVVEAWSLGYPVAVISDCVFDRSELSHQVGLFDMHLKYATVIPVSTACDLIRNA